MTEDSVIERMYDEQPLLLFSLYTNVQAHTLIDFGHKLLSTLDGGSSEGRIESGVFLEVYGLFWLWVLGAYEVVRTMSQYPSCFSPSVRSELQAVKRSLHKVRIPFAKQELRGRKGSIVRYVQGELSVASVDTAPKDFGYKIEGSVVSVRSLVGEFERFIHSIRRVDVLDAFPNGDAEKGQG